MTEIVAEISGNHGGSLENAVTLIAEAKRAGADAVKFQCFDPEKLAAKRTGIRWQGIDLVFDDLADLYWKTLTPRDWFPTLIAQSELVGIPWFSSVFDPADVEFLETLNCPRYKISAYEMLDGDLINAVKATGKPIVMSVRPRLGLTILQATDYDGSNWVPMLGISDHSPVKWDGVTPIAVEMAGQHTPMIERHICLLDVETPDTEFSSTPDDFAAYVKAIRSAEK